MLADDVTGTYLAGIDLLTAEGVVKGTHGDGLAWCVASYMV